MQWWHPLLAIVVLVVVALIALAVYDRTQRTHAILRNYPIIGHFRYLLERVGPELRQYIVTDNDQERPFSRDQRTWVYRAAKAENTYFGFGSDNDFDEPHDYLIVKHSQFPLDTPVDAESPATDRPLPCIKVLGGAHGRAHAFRPASVVNVSAMSYGSLSGAAVEALNRGCARAGSLHSTGEGGISPFHRNGADLVWQIGTGYFGCRDDSGHFDLARLIDVVSDAPVRAIEIKLSQGAKPGLGGVLPAAKVTPEIAAIRGVPVGITCRSPAAHSAFGDVDSLIEFIETIAGATGLPVGIKSAVGDEAFWHHLAGRMVATGGGPDFITIDGGEGGTGAAPLSFADHVSLPFRWAFPRVFRSFAAMGIDGDLVFIGSGRLGLPDAALAAFATGCDMVNVGRTALFSIGCIQAQRCETDRCPTGVATQDPRLVRGLDVADKSVRCANYLATIRFELERMARACGVPHPSMVTPDQIEVLGAQFQSRSLGELSGYEQGWAVPRAEDVDALLAVPGWAGSRRG